MKQTATDTKRFYDPSWVIEFKAYIAGIVSHWKQTAPIDEYHIHTKPQ